MKDKKLNQEEQIVEESVFSHFLPTHNKGNYFDSNYMTRVFIKLLDNYPDKEFLMYRKARSIVYSKKLKQEDKEEAHQIINDISYTKEEYKRKFLEFKTYVLNNLPEKAIEQINRLILGILNVEVRDSAIRHLFAIDFLSFLWEEFLKNLPKFDKEQGNAFTFLTSIFQKTIRYYQKVLMYKSGILTERPIQDLQAILLSKEDMDMDLYNRVINVLSNILHPYQEKSPEQLIIDNPYLMDYKLFLQNISNFKTRYKLFQIINFTILEIQNKKRSVISSINLVLILLPQLLWSIFLLNHYKDRTINEIMSSLAPILKEIDKKVYHRGFTKDKLLKYLASMFLKIEILLLSILQLFTIRIGKGIYKDLSVLLDSYKLYSISYDKNFNPILFPFFEKIKTGVNKKEFKAVKSFLIHFSHIKKNILNNLKEEEKLRKVIASQLLSPIEFWLFQFFFTKFRDTVLQDIDFHSFLEFTLNVLM